MLRAEQIAINLYLLDVTHCQYYCVQLERFHQATGQNLTSPWKSGLRYITSLFFSDEPLSEVRARLCHPLDGGLVILGQKTVFFAYSESPTDYN